MIDQNLMMKQDVLGITKFYLIKEVLFSFFLPFILNIYIYIYISRLTWIVFQLDFVFVFTNLDVF
jgi:hypothetical protein